MFEVAGTQFEKGVFEIYLEKKAPGFIRWILKLGPVRARIVGIAMLSFSFLFSTSKSPSNFILEKGIASSMEAALKIQQDIGYALFFVAVLFYMTVFFFRNERMEVIFDKGSKIFSIIQEPFFRFSPTKRGHVPFQDIEKVEKIAAGQAPDAPHGKLVIRSSKMPGPLQKIEFRVLTDEQFEFFPLNIERILGL